MQLAFKQVDVFTDRPFLGNPVAVVIGAEGLDAQTMQRIAGWTNLSETTFLLKSEVADYRLRIFTPRQELPFAGHPAIGSAHAALESGFVPKKNSLKQECGAGVIELTVEDKRLFLRGPQARIGDVRKTLPSPASCCASTSARSGWWARWPTAASSRRSSPTWLRLPASAWTTRPPA